MALEFDPATHAYRLDGAPVPGATQILRDAGLVCFDGIPQYILERARERGSAVHQLCHYLNERDLNWASVDPHYRPYLDAWITFCETSALVVLLCEYRVASRRHRTAGTLDVLGEIGDVGWLLDYKTGDPNDVAADLQTAAYLGMATEQAATDPELAAVLGRHAHWRRAAVRLRNTGRVNVTEYTNPRDYGSFQMLAAAWHIRASRGAVSLPIEELVA